ncbi:MAG: hypothetical protein RLZZ538_1149 [Actinomycetota bacterium]|jgi:hypothetical protein
MFRRTVVVAQGDAMRPGIFAGDVLVVQRSRDRHYRIGDVVAYRTSHAGRAAHVGRVCEVRQSPGSPDDSCTEYLVHFDNDIGVVHARHIVGEVESRLVRLGKLSSTSRAHRSPFSLSAYAPAPSGRRKVSTTQAAAD